MNNERKNDEPKFIKIVKLLFCKRHCKENEETSYILRENMWTILIWKMTSVKLCTKLLILHQRKIIWNWLGKNCESTSYENSKIVSQHLMKEDIPILNKHVKGGLASSVIKEFQIKQQWDNTTSLLEGLTSKTS